MSCPGGPGMKNGLTLLQNAALQHNDSCKFVSFLHENKNNSDWYAKQS